MTIEDNIKYWKEAAHHDMDSMVGIFEAGKYDWALFVGHLALEKILKAHWIKNNKINIPPKIHNLVQLYKESSLSFLEEDEITFLNEVTRYNIEGRYPEVKYAFYKLCTKEFAESRITRINKLYKWLLKEI